MGQGSIGTCPICLQDVNPAEESFIETCLHHFCLQCIKAWVKSQPVGVTTVPCPVCKRPFTSIIHDCQDVAYRIWHIDGSDEAGHVRDGFALTPAHRRRRSVYIQELLEQSEPFEKKGKFLTIALLKKPVVGEWLHRELQALLLQADVNLVKQHILGTLIHTLDSKTNGKRGHHPETARLNAVEAAEVGGAAAAPLVGQYSKRLGQELVKFVLSGLNIEAYDEIVYRLSPESDAAAAGGGKEEEEEEEEAPPA